MHISERAIELPRLIILGAVLFCVLGLVAAFSLPKERTPRVRLPVIIVAVPNPGAPPEVNEAQIIRKIEDEAGTLTGLKDDGAILSQAMNGAAVAMFLFDNGVEVNEAKRDVQDLINRIKGEFPPEAQNDPGPIVRDIAFEDWPIIQVFIAGGKDGVQRRRIAERLQDEIENINGVAVVDIFGGLEREIQIEVDPQRMILYGFTYGQLEAALRRGNVEAPSGAIEASNGGEARVRTLTKFADIDEIRDLPLGVREGKSILLADVAQVRMGHPPTKSIARYGGEDAVVLLARAKTDVDVLGTANAVQGAVDAFIEHGGGEDTHIGTVRSQAREIHYMISQLGTSAVYGTILVILILWVFLGWRNAALISLSVPFAILATAGLMWVAKRTIAPDLAINSMTLFAMILVVGMVVDGCIIVGENIYRHRELGRSPLDAAKRGITEVGTSLLSAYLTTFAAFAPMFLIRGIMGDFMELLPTVVLFALCSAMLVDHFLLPVLSVYFMKVPKARLEAVRAEQNAVGQGRTNEEIEIANAQAIAASDRVKRVYGRMLGYALHHRLLVLFLAAAVSFTPAILFVIGAIGFEFFPDSDMAIIEVYYELPLGSSIEKKTVDVGRQIEAAVLRAVRPEEWYHPKADGPPVKPVTTIGEPGALNIRLDVDHGAGPEYGMVYVELELAESRQRHVSAIRQAVAAELPPMPGVIVRITSPREGPPTGAPVLVRVLAQRQTTIPALAERAHEIERMLRSIPGTYDVTIDHHVRPELEVKINRNVAGLYDLDAATLNAAVNYALEGVRVGEVDFGTDKEIDLRIRNLPASRDQVEDLANLPLRGATGKIVSLDQVADIQRVQNANIIQHYDQKRVVNIRCQLQDGVIPDHVKAQLVRMLRPELSAVQQHAIVQQQGSAVVKSDEQVTVEFGGENEIRDDALADLKVALVLSIAAMMIILTIKFNSFVQPLIVLFSVPLSLVGVSIGLMLCGFYFSVSAMIGVVALSGIVVNDAIVLVDFINRLTAAGVPIEQAVIYAGQLRLRPIFLTTVTTVAGLLPLALNLSGGGEFWQPLTVSIMCGLGFATLLQLFIIPLACYTFRPRHRSVFDPTQSPTLTAAPAAV